MLLLIIICAFSASFLTLFSGFGLGTLLMPVIAIFFPLPVAIAITAIVHLLNNIFKLLLLRKNVKWNVTWRFAFPAIIASFMGAFLLSYLVKLPSILTYHILAITASVHPVKIIVGMLLCILATLEWRRFNITLKVSRQCLPLGGLISGFFGGLSGQQGAFRSAFLLHVGLNKEEFVSTNVSIAVLVDVTRLLVYISTFSHLLIYNVDLIFTATIAALLGASLGVIYLKKITFRTIQIFVGILLYILAALLISGII